MVGQRRFLKPDTPTLEWIVTTAKAGGTIENVWLGPDEAWKYLARYSSSQTEEKTISGLKKIFDRYPYMFAEERDGKPYEWLRELGAYSPIIHLQQTDGTTSGHAPFTAVTNEKGIIKGKEFFGALLAAYDKPADSSMPPRSDAIYLSFEIFISNTAYLRDSLDGLKKSVEYWREFIPENGVDLKVLVDRVNRRNQ